MITNFLISHYWKQMHLAEHTFQSATLVFSGLREKSTSMPQSLSVSEKEIQCGLSIQGAGLWGYLPRCSWCSGLRLQESSTGITIRGLWTLCASVKCAKTIYIREWLRSVHFNNSIVTMNYYFYFLEDNLARNVIRKLKACYLQTMNNRTLQENSVNWLPSNRRAEPALKKKKAHGRAETSRDDVTWQCLTIATLLSMLFLSMEIWRKDWWGEGVNYASHAGCLIHICFCSA